MKCKILVACGTGAATSTFVAARLKEELEGRGFAAVTAQCRIQDIGLYLSGVDVIVTTSKVEEVYDVPVFSGIPFLRDSGTDELLDQIAKVLETKKSEEVF